MRFSTTAAFKRVLALGSLTLALLILSPDVVSQTPQAIKRSSFAIALTADGATLLVVNPDSNSLTLVDTVSLEPLAEIPAGVDPRTVAVDDTGSQAYVANRGSDSVSVVDVAAQLFVYQLSIFHHLPLA